MTSEYFESVDLEDFRPLVAFNFQDINLGVLDHYTLRVIAEFARRSKSIIRTVHIDGQKGNDEYLISLDHDYLLLEIANVKVDGVCIKKNCRRCNCTTGKYNFKNGKLVICDFVGCKIEVEVIASPSHKSCRIDADVFNIWGDVIASGLNATLMKSNDKRWRNKALSSGERRLFLIGCEEAKEVAQRRNVADKVYHAKTAKNKPLNYKNSVRI